MLPRKNGSTEWIFRAALRDPRCIIIFVNNEVAGSHYRKYLKIKEKQNIFKRLFWKLTKRPNPIFMGYENIRGLDGLDRPVVYDNSITYLL